MYHYHSNFTEADYVLNTNQYNQSEAEGYCNSQGGHLVSYASQYEQLEVEGYYIGRVSCVGLQSVGCCCKVAGRPFLGGSASSR